MSTPAPAPAAPGSDEAAAPSTPAIASGPAISVEQHPGSTATATQDDVSNLNVSVRVGSPGDDGDVSQANRATATSTASSTAAGPPEQPASAEPGPDSADAQATAVQQEVSNTNVAVRVFSPGDNGAVLQENAAAASAASDPEPGPETGPSSFQGTDAAVIQNGAQKHERHDPGGEPRHGLRCHPDDDRDDRVDSDPVE